MTAPTQPPRDIDAILDAAFGPCDAATAAWIEAALAQRKPQAGCAVRSKAHCCECRTEVTVTGHQFLADNHPQMRTIALPGGIRGFVDCPGSGQPVLWLVPESAVTR